MPPGNAPKVKIQPQTASPFRTDVQYRTDIDAQGTPVNVGCGYMLKPEVDGGYQQRVMPQMVVVFVLRGSGTHTDWQGQSFRVKPGSMIIYPPKHKHSMTHDADGQWVEFFFTIPPQIYQALQAMGSLSPYRTVYQPGTGHEVLEHLDSIHRLMRQTTDQSLAQVWALCHVVLVQMILQDRRQTRQQDRLPDNAPSASRQQIDQACQILSKDLSQKLTPAAVADRLDMGYEHFRKLFREAMGISPGEFRIRRRLDLARKLIAVNKLSNKQVAYQLGYADPFTFSKQFRKYTGQSPAAFRKSL